MPSVRCYLSISALISLRHCVLTLVSEDVERNPFVYCHGGTRYVTPLICFILVSYIQVLLVQSNQTNERLNQQMQSQEIRDEAVLLAPSSLAPYEEDEGDTAVDDLTSVESHVELARTLRKFIVWFT
jgi:hypothetical protein